MLNKKDLVKKIEEIDIRLVPMIEKVNIYNFTKCIAQYAGLEVKNVSDAVIEEYLITWARNKYPFYKLLGERLQLDKTIDYQNPLNDIDSNMRELMDSFPGYAPWIGYFRNQRKNKIDSLYDIPYEAREYISTLFPSVNINGSTMTHFFASCLKAPDDLVTAIGRLFEGGTVKGTWTLSIDPVDMMLASENPYGWNSCYRLTADNSSSHADGCLAAILDDSSLISYIWSSEGKMKLYEHTLEGVRFKRIRGWISMSPTLRAIHFNNLYPTKGNYGEDFEKQLRSYTEKIVADYLGIRDSWKINKGSCYCEREYFYGYGEFSEDYIFVHSDSEEREGWTVYNKEIKCPCGCGNIVPGTDYCENCDYDYDEGELSYNGRGLIYENFEYRHFCDYVDDYCNCACDRCEENCRGCSAWDDMHPYCDIAQTGAGEDYICENPDSYYVSGGMMEACSGHCEGCPMWAAHHQHSYEEVNREEEAIIPAENYIHTTHELLSLRLADVVADYGYPDISLGQWTITRDNESGLAYNPGDPSISIEMPSIPASE